MLWLADRVDEGLAKYRAEQGIEDSWPARERIVVGLTGGPEGEVLIRRGGPDPEPGQRRGPAGGPRPRRRRRAGESPQALEAQRRLVQDLGGSYHIVAGEDPAAALLDFARSVNATQIVVGISRHKKLAGPARRPPRRRSRHPGGPRLRRHRRPHGLPPARRPRHRPAARSGDLGRVRVAVGFVLAVLLPVVLQLLLCCLNPDQNVATAMLVQLTGSVAVALIGGLWPAILGRTVEQPAGELLLHPAGGQPDHQRSAELPGPAGLRGRLGRRCRRGGPLGPPLQGGRPGPRRSRHAR